MWLKKCSVKRSLGIHRRCWIPLFETPRIKGASRSSWSNRDIFRVAARPKTDVLDAQWIQRLHLLRPLAWVVPASEFRVGSTCLLAAAADAGALRRQP